MIESDMRNFLLKTKSGVGVRITIRRTHVRPYKPILAKNSSLVEVFSHDMPPNVALRRPVLNVHGSSRHG